MVPGQTAVNRTRTFQGAACVLNSLQTRAAALERLHARRAEDPRTQLRAMQGFLHRAGITVGELDKLNIIHVTGTKGKGSTCAFTERILRNYGFRTGFYSSPHLVHVRERIRINGRPISEELFTKYFWETYERLEDTKDVCGGSTPFYFQFLTVMAFYVFLQERVDLAVIEVGIGGQYDCTNVIRRPWACGVTSLGLDHCSLLGDTVDQIAWQKAGIFKPGVPAFTVRQPPSSLRVLQRRAERIGCPLLVCPDLQRYEAAVGPVSLGLAGKHQRLNASLALQLSFSWLRRHEAEARGDVRTLNSEADAFQPSKAMLRGLQQTQWSGRSQTLRRGSVTFYLDGAHTAASLQAAVRWFRDETLRTERAQYDVMQNIKGPGLKVLLFNTTGERDSAALLRLLLPCRFDYALFCPNITEEPAAPLGLSVSAQQMSTRCRENRSSWRSLNASEAAHHRRPPVDDSCSRSLVFPCIPSALRWIGREKQPVSEPAGSLRSPESSDGLQEARHVSVLVTGSLYLVGGALKHLEPSLNSS